MTTFTTTVASSTWASDIITLLRVLIDDVDATTYTNARLTDVVVVAAHFISREINFDYEYIVDIPSQTMNVDPDADFKNFAALKAAILILNAELKSMTKTALTIKDGPSTIETGRGLSHLQKLYDETLDQYVVARASFRAGYFRAILSPFTTPNSNTVESFA